MFLKGFCTVALTIFLLIDHASIAAATTVPQSSSQSSAAQNSSADFEDVIVRFHKVPSKAELNAFKGLGGNVDHTFTIIPAISGKIPAKAIEALKKNPLVEEVELDLSVQALGYSPGNELGNSWGIDYINADSAHASGYSGEGVKVAVLDSGVNFNHFDLSDNFDFATNELGYDFVTDDYFPDDVNGHGTHVAGTLAAASNGFGVVGVAPKTQIVSLRILDDSGAGSISRVIEALQWIVDYNADHPDAPIRITNNSYGTESYSSQLQAAFDASARAGVLHIAAAGNAGNFAGSGDNITYPAKYESVVAVAAINSNNLRASWSSTGADVELSAPGVSVLSAWNDGTSYENPQPFPFAGSTGTYFKESSGTSMASPHVAGVAALMLASNPNYTAEEVRSKMNETALDVGTVGRDSQYGYGMVDASSAVGIAPITNDPPVANDQTVNTTKNISVDITLDAIDPDGDPLTYTITANPANGILSGTAPNMTYSPNAEFTGVDAFKYEVKDSGGLAASASCNITVEAPPVSTVNLAPKGTISSSVNFERISYVNDNQSNNTANYANGVSGLQWVQVDLGTATDLNKVKLWHYYGDGRSYRDVVIQLSNDVTFSSGVVTVFNNDRDGSTGLGVGTDSEYSETISGKTIEFDTVNARYARFYSKGSNVNTWNHYVEIEVYGVEPQIVPTVNLAPKGTISSSVNFERTSYVNDNQSNNTANYANGVSGLQWMQVDLGAATDLNKVKLWHYYGDGRSYRDVVIQLSNDVTFSSGVMTVFNNDRDGSTGLGVGMNSEYSETSSGKTIAFDAVKARYVRFYSKGSNVNTWNHYVEIEVYGVEPQIVPTVNLAPKGTISSSVNFERISYVNDNQSNNTANYANGVSGLQWVQVDLGTATDLNKVKLWHYYGDGRSYRDVVIQLSNDVTFSSGVMTVFNNDRDGSTGLGVGMNSEYSETSSGKTIAFDAVKARYVRFYSKGSNVNTWNHYVEIEVYGVEPQIVPTVNLAPKGTISSSVNFERISYVNDNQSNNTANYANGVSGLQWVQVDLGTATDLNKVKLWHYYGDGRSYRDVVIQLSNDVTFSSGVMTVFNNDRDGSTGLGVGMNSEYSETSSGKTIAFDAVKARYARFYSNGSNVNTWNHYVETEVYGSAP